jgi:hypothetical protein
MNVAILYDDPFARNGIALFLARDRRTRLLGDASDWPTLTSQLDKKKAKTELLLIQADDSAKFSQALHSIPLKLQGAGIMGIGQHVDLHILKSLLSNHGRGYVLKDEIPYSISWACGLARSGVWVTTPGPEKLANESRIDLPRPCLVMQKRQLINLWTFHRSHAARLAFLFSMERRDLADELGIQASWAYGLVSELYDDLGMKKLFSGALDIQEYFGDDSEILRHLTQLMQSASSAGKKHDLETLAFYLLTMPDVTRLS